MISDFAQLIDRLGGIREFGEAVGMSYGAAKKARRRNSLSPRYFGPTIELAKAKGEPVTLQSLHDLAVGK